VLIEHILRRKGHEVATVTAEATVAEAVDLLREHNIGALVVVSEERPVIGIFSERDVVRELGARGPAVLDRPVQQLMSTEVTTCDRRTTASELMRLMTDRRIRHIPVVEERTLVGIVSIGDVVKHRLDELEAETETLHDYLATGRG
jgi:CBS domain-containing protein